MLTYLFSDKLFTLFLLFVLHLLLFPKRIVINDSKLQFMVRVEYLLIVIIKNLSKNL